MSVVKLKFSLLVVMALALGASAQDLGSSNKLFGGSKKPTAEKTAKKPSTALKPIASKPKAAAPKSKSSKTVEKKPKTSTAKTSTAKKPAATAAKPKFTEFKEAGPSKVEITVGKAPTIVAEPKRSSEERYEDLIEAGNAARDDRNYSGAESAYKSARVLKPKDPRATYSLGNLYSDQQRWEDAENAYRAALQIDPDNAIAHVALSYVLTQPIAAPDLADRYEEAEKVARKAIQLAPANALAFDQLGASLELRGLIGAETENAYRKAIQLDPGFAPAYAHLGRLLRRRGMKQESAAAYENAINRSNDVATLILVAEVLQSEQRYAESEQLLRRALGGDPRNPAALLLLGRALMAQSKFVDAEKTLLSNLAVTTNGFAGNSLLGSLYSRQGLFDRAEAALMDAARSVSPREKRGLSMQFESVGDGFMKTGNRRAAERVYRQAITFDAENQALVGKLSKAQRG